MDELLKSDHEIINDAWKFLKKYALSSESLDDDFLQLYRKHNAAEDDFASMILDAVLREVQSIRDR